MKKMMMLSAAAVLALFCGCRNQLVTIDVNPSDATVIAAGKAYNGKSPFCIEVPRDKQLTITAYKEGYREKIMVIDYSLTPQGKCFAWTSFLIIPSIGLLCDGSYQLNQNNVHLKLEQLNNKVNDIEIEPGVINIQAGEGMNHTTDENAAGIFNQI